MTDEVAGAEPAVGIEPHLSLAFAMHGTPGAYALLLGAGLSVTAGVPSAWKVQEELLRKLASAQGETPDDPFAWYHEKYQRHSTYSELLEALTHSQAGRQKLLEDFFKPTAEEHEQGLKQPARAHWAIARLVARGLVKVILTTNFDRLMEVAIEQATRAHPTVVASPADIYGLSPLHTQEHLVVHLHGDYLNPTGMLNTAEELRAYPSVVNDLLDKLFPEYGLVIAGWSATWDHALRDAITRNPNRHYATYWVDPSPLSQVAQDLRIRRGATYVRGDADTFFERLADACEAIEDTGRRHPLTVPIAVATAKRALDGTRSAIPLHDTIRQEMESLRALDALNTTDFIASDVGQEHSRRLGRIEAALEVPLALVATAAYWGNESTDAWWFDDIARFGLRPTANGLVDLINLLQLPATAILYAAGIAAVGARRHELLVRLLSEPTTTNNQDERVPVASYLMPNPVWGCKRSHRRLHLLLQPILEGQLGLGEAAYRDASERFEYLRLTQATFDRLPRKDLLQEIVRWEQEIDRIEVALARPKARTVATQHVHRDKYGNTRKLKTDEEELQRARNEARQALHQLPGYAPVGPSVPHIRAFNSREGGYTPAPAQALQVEILRAGAEHPLVRAGLCGGDVDNLRLSMAAVDGSFHVFSHDAAASELPLGGGILRGTPFYPDEIGKWAEAAAG
jgi:hypothetical protein